MRISDVKPVVLFLFLGCAMDTDCGVCPGLGKIGDFRSEGEECGVFLWWNDSTYDTLYGFEGDTLRLTFGCGQAPVIWHTDCPIVLEVYECCETVTVTDVYANDAIDATVEWETSVEPTQMWVVVGSDTTHITPNGTQYSHIFNWRNSPRLIFTYFGHCSSVTSF